MLIYQVCYFLDNGAFSPVDVESTFFTYELAENKLNQILVLESNTQVELGIISFEVFGVPNFETSAYESVSDNAYLESMEQSLNSLDSVSPDQIDNALKIIKFMYELGVEFDYIKVTTEDSLRLEIICNEEKGLQIDISPYLNFSYRILLPHICQNFTPTDPKDFIKSLKDYEIIH